MIREKAQVHSFEPVPATFQTLSHNLKNNQKYENVFLNNFALGLADDTLNITIDRYAGNHIVLNSQKEDSNNELALVQIKRLDDYVAQKNIQKISFIKCDVEGAEYLVLQGGRKILTDHRPELFLEITEEWCTKFNYKPLDILKYLDQLNYVGYQFINSKTLLHFDSSQAWNHKINNYVFKPKEKINLENSI